MYRAVTLLALRRNVAPDDAAALAAIARNLDFTSRDATPAEAQDGRQYTVMVEGEDVSQLLRSGEVEELVSPIAAVPQVRVELVARQREMARQQGNIIMIGRDIGSVVLPDADLKVYLDASPAVRARRRSRQETQTTEAARRGLEKRDLIDSSRAAAPLVVAPGALVIDTDDLSQQEVLEKIKAALTALKK
jgi:cytidylate kinase